MIASSHAGVLVLPTLANLRESTYNRCISFRSAAESSSTRALRVGVSESL